MQTYDLPDHYRGDYWTGIPSIQIIRNAIPLDLSAAEVHMQFKATSNGPVVVDFSTITGTLCTVAPLSAGTISVPGTIINWSPGTYYYDLQVKAPMISRDFVKTYLKGSWTILQDITR